MEASIQEFETLRTVRDMIVAALGQPKSARVSLIGLDGTVSKDSDHERLRLDGSELIVGPEGSESLLAYVND